MAPSPAHKNLFISYARADDEPFVKKLYQHLTENNLQVWWDRQDMPNRALTFLQEIRDAVNNADRLLLVFGPGALDSDYVRAEWEYALSICKPVLTVLRTGDYPQIPDQLKHQDIPDFRDDDDFDTKFQYLLRQLQDQPAPLGTLYTLPALPQPYIPRNAYLIELIQRVCADLHQPTVITSKHHMNIVIGMGGIGKTTLANALARDCTVRRAFPDGVFWLEIGQSPSITTRMGDIGVAFGDTWSEYPDETRACSRLSALMEHKQALIILDDVWEHGHVEPFRRVIGNRCRLLVTTRQTKLATIFSKQPLEITTLNEEEGLTLISDRLARQSDAPNPYEQTERAIVRLLGGHTLSISLAAALLAEQGANYAPRLLTRLEQKGVFHDLKLDDNDKNLNLELSLSLSYADLDSDDQRRFRLLSVFVAESSFDVPAIAAVWSEQDMDTTEDALTRLHRKGLIRRENNDRFSLHMLLRAYARALMNPEEIEIAHKQLFNHYYKLYIDDKSLDETNHKDMDRDFPNILNCIRWGFKYRPAASCDLVTRLNYYIELRQPRSLLRRLLEQSRVTAISVNYYLGQANATKNLGDLDQVEAKYDQAKKRYLIALILYRNIGDSLGAANTLLNLGDLNTHIANYDEAEICYNEALSLHEKIPNYLGQANTFHSLGLLKFITANYKAANSFFDRALSLSEFFVSRIIVVNILKAKGDLAKNSGDYAKAREYYEESMNQAQNLSSLLGQANALKGLGKLNIIESHYAEARSCLQKAKDIYENLNAESGLADTHLELGNLDKNEGKFAEAHQHLNIALEKFKAIPSSLGQANTILYLGELLYCEGKYLEASSHYEKAISMFRQIQDRLGEISSLAGLAQVRIAQGENREGCRLFKDAFKILDSIETNKNDPDILKWRREYLDCCGQS